MSSHICLRVHFVWSTARREELIEPEWAGRLYAYMGTVMKDLDVVMLEAGGMWDHVHVYASLPATIGLAELMNKVKANSSRWVKENFGVKDFGWQSGYGAFSVSASADAEVRAYIRNQAEHHRVRSFQEEYVMFLERYGVEFDTRYLFE